MSYKKGDTVWSGRGKFLKQMTVAKRHDNGLIPVYQYTFEAPNDGFACGEQSLRATADGRDLRISECPKDDETEEDYESQTAVKINTITSAMRHPIMMDRTEIGDYQDLFRKEDVFFRPDLKFVDWIKERANGRFIIDVGSGQGHLVNMLKMRGAKAMGLEPNFNLIEFMKFRSLRNLDGDFDVNEILPRTIQQAKSLIEGMGADKVMLVFARPSHSGFVEEGIKNMPKGMEALYISTIENIKNNIDLGRFVLDAEPLEYNGNSEDEEGVLSIIRK